VSCGWGFAHGLSTHWGHEALKVLKVLKIPIEKLKRDRDPIVCGGGRAVGILIKKRESNTTIFKNPYRDLSVII